MRCDILDPLGYFAPAQRGKGLEMRVVTAVVILLLATTGARAGLIQLTFVSDSGFATGTHAGQPIELLLMMDGATGTQSWIIEYRVSFFGVTTRALLNIDGAAIADLEGEADGRLHVDEGLNWMVVRMYDLEVQFSASASDGPVLPNMPYSPEGISIVDECLREGIFTPRSYEPHFEPSFIKYGEQTAELTRLEVRIVPSPTIFSSILSVLICIPRGRPRTFR